MGRQLVVAGMVLVGVGLVLWLGGGRWLGTGLPGDIHFRRGNVSFHFPVVTCLVLSAVVTVLLRWWGR